MSGTVQPVDKVGVRLRIDVTSERNIPYVELDVGARSASLTPTTVRALMEGLARMLELAEDFEKEERARLGEPESDDK